MEILKKNKSWKKEYVHQKDGVTAKIRIEKLDCVGSPLGSISIKGNGLDCKLTNDSIMSQWLQLDRFSARRNVVKLGHKLSEKHHCEIDWGNLHDLFAPAFNELFKDFKRDQEFDSDELWDKYDNDELSESEKY